MTEKSPDLFNIVFVSITSFCLQASNVGPIHSQKSKCPEYRNNLQEGPNKTILKLKMEKNNLIFKSDLLGVVDLSFSAVSVGAFILFNCVLAHSIL